MRFPPQFLDELRTRVSLAQVIGRKVKLVKKGREHMGLCPFHSEKTPSFTVSEEKGFYHCFGCGAHGDAIAFLTELEGLAFPEAVERLAGEAGMEIPRLSQEEEEAYSKRSSLYDVLEVAAGWFENKLASSQGEEAGDYLKKRGLSGQTIGHFRLGFAPRSRSAFKEAMLARKIAEDQLVESGMLVKPEDKDKTYDRFRNRIIFPITDARDRVIAF
ncbi:MAG: DNA primase, partial [Proteobacteria bacterium]|nr:DNA primase [Pseudomonadota bacterium]